MISLHMQFVPKPGKEKELRAAIIDKWIEAMSKQPGFIKAVMVKPYSPEEIARLKLPAPKHAFEVVSFWSSEAERAAWAARPIHNEVYGQVLAAAESRVTSLQEVVHTWNL